MRAVVAERSGGPEVLHVAERNAPVPGAGEVIIRLAMTSVNMVDTIIRAGRMIKAGAGVPPYIPGLDATGRIEAVGPGVTRFKPGDRVTAFTEGGAYAELVRAREVLTYAVPEEADDVAVCSMVAMVAAWNILNFAGGFQSGDTVLVHAAAGAVGSMVIQLAKLSGAGLVVGLVGSDDKVAAVLKYGADAAFTYDRIDAAKDLVEGGFDVILDANAGDRFMRNLDVLAPFGRLVCFGEASGASGTVTTGPMVAGNRSVIGYSSAHYRAHRPDVLRPAAEGMIDLAAKGRLIVPVAARFPLEDAAEAHRLIESRQTKGKVLLHP